MSFAEKIAEKLAQQRAAASGQTTPELEAKLDQFIRDNPRLHERLTAMSKEELVRRLMAEKIGRGETVAHRNRELERWVGENPEIVAKVEQRLKNLPGANRQSATVKITETETLKQNMRPPGMRL